MKLAGPLHKARAAGAHRRAFTLIELLVVILILAILIAVALPSFLGQTEKASNSVIVQRLAVAQVDAKAIWTSDGQSGFPATDQMRSALQKAEPGYQFVDDDSGTQASKTTIGVSVNSAEQNIILCQESGSGTYYCLSEDPTAGLLSVSGAQDTAAAAHSTLGLASANADSGYTTVLRAVGTTEQNALCVIDAGLPGTGTGDASSCSPGGYAGWTHAFSAADISAAQAATTAPINTAPPTITGQPATGATLTASPGAWTPTPSSYAYQWEACTGVSGPTGTGCSAISGATSPSFTTTSAYAGKYIVVSVTAANSIGTSSPAVSDSAGQVGSLPANTAAPSASGTPVPDGALTVTNGTWSSSPTSYRYQWQQCAGAGTGCTNISGATSSTYIIPVGTASGSYFRAVVAAANAVGSATATSNNVITEGPLPTGETGTGDSNSLLVSGTINAGDTLVLISKCSGGNDLTSITDPAGDHWNLNVVQGTYPGAPTSEMSTTVAQAPMSSGQAITMTTGSAYSEPGVNGAVLVDLTKLAAANGIALSGTMDTYNSGHVSSKTISMSATTSASPDIALSGLAVGAAVTGTITYTMPAGWTELPDVYSDGGDTTVVQDVAYKLLPSAGSVSATWSYTEAGDTNPSTAATLAAFK